MVLTPTPQRGPAGKELGGGRSREVTLRSQVTHEELSAGEHALVPGAVPPPHAFPRPVALTAAGRPGQPEGKEEKDSTPGSLCPNTIPAALWVSPSSWKRVHSQQEDGGSHLEPTKASQAQRNYYN